MWITSRSTHLLGVPGALGDLRAVSWRGKGGLVAVEVLGAGVLGSSMGMVGDCPAEEGDLGDLRLGEWPGVIFKWNNYISSHSVCTCTEWWLNIRCFDELHALVQNIYHTIIAIFCREASRCYAFAILSIHIVMHVQVVSSQALEAHVSHSLFKPLCLSPRKTNQQWPYSTRTHLHELTQHYISDVVCRNPGYLDALASPII